MFNYINKYMLGKILDVAPFQTFKEMAPNQGTN